MKKLSVLSLFILLLLSPSVLSEDFSDNNSVIEHAWDGQKPITDAEFEKAINTLTEKQKKKDEKTKKKKIRKISGGGTSLHKGLEPTGEILEQETLKEKGEFDGQLLNIPVDVIVDGKIMERGYYNVFGEKDKSGDVYLSFYQAHFFKGKVKAKITKNDFDDENLDFVKLEPYDEEYVRIMYGSLDFNAYTYLRYIQK
jgi:hypothetical protein